jgi:hypothetical protein
MIISSKQTRKEKSEIMTVDEIIRNRRIRLFCSGFLEGVEGILAED